MTGTCRPGTDVAHESDQVRRFLNVDACPDHAPARLAGRPAPGTTAYHLEPRYQTLASAQGGSDVDKARPGGYVSRQRARRIGNGTAPRQSR